MPASRVPRAGDINVSLLDDRSSPGDERIEKGAEDRLSGRRLNDTPRRSTSRLRSVIATWPRRAAAIAVSAALGWLVTQTLPTLWQEAAEQTGLAPSAVQVEVVKDPDQFTTLDAAHNPEFVVQRSIDAVGPPPNGDNERGRFRWAKQMGGIDATSTVLRLVIRARTPKPVILNSLDVEKVAERPPLDGTLLSYFGQGSGQPVRYFDIDLDRDPAKVEHIVKGSDRPTEPFPYRVTDGEVEVFDILASTLKSDIKWRLVLHYTSAGKSGAMIIDDDGRPFETTSGHAAHFYGWLDGHWSDDGS